MSNINTCHGCMIMKVCFEKVCLLWPPIQGHRYDLCTMSLCEHEKVNVCIDCIAEDRNK